MELLIFIGVMAYVWFKIDRFADDINPYNLVTSVNSETATSGNLLPNAGDGQSSYQNTTDAYAPDKVGSGQGFTIDSGIQAFQNELEAKGEGIVSDTGSLVGITTTKQNGGSHTTTTDSLDGGVRLKCNN